MRQSNDKQIYVNRQPERTREYYHFSGHPQPHKVWSLESYIKEQLVGEKKKKKDSICLSVTLISSGKKFRERDFQQ